MKIVFIVIGVESLAVEFLSSFLKQKGHQVELVFDPRLFSSEAVRFKKLADFFDTGEELVEQVIKKKPDLVGFSVFTLNYQRALKLARDVKRNNKKLPIIFGGIHPTSVPEVVIKEKAVDMICVGEGEEALFELLGSYQDHRERFDIRNLWFKKNGKVVKNSCRPLIKNIDRLPYPDKDLFYDIYPGFSDDYYTISSRGCPFNCTYCANNVLNNIYKGLGKPFRQRSPENMIGELIRAKKKFAIKKVTFVDDVFVQNFAWLDKFTKLYKDKVNLPYTMLTHPRFVTFQTAKLLADSGCYFLAFGIQSASQSTRMKILKRFETNEEIRKAAASCHKAGIKFSIDHIFNIPGEGLKESQEALGFYNQLRPAAVNSYWLQYFPKTEIVNIALKKGLINKSMIKKIEEGKTSTSLVVGLGGKDTINPDLIYTNLQFYFTLLPVLPKWLINKIIEKKVYLMRFKPPMFVNIGLKLFINLLNKRGGVYLGIVKSIFYFMRVNIGLKYVT